MSTRTEQLREVLDANHAEMRSLIESLAPEQLRRKTEAGWTVGQMAGHIAASASGDIYVAKRLAQGKAAELPGFLSFIINIANWWGVRKFKTASTADIVAACDEGHQALTGFVSGLTEEQLDRAAAVMTIGRISTFDYLKRSPAHTQEHAALIRRALAG